MSGAGGIDVKRALGTYVIGRDAGYDPALKQEIAESRLDRGSAAGSSRESAAEPAFRAGDAGGRPSFGVPVPGRLAFHRSASRWRDLIPGLRSGGA